MKTIHQTTNENLKLPDGECTVLSKGSKLTFSFDELENFLNKETEIGFLSAPITL